MCVTWFVETCSAYSCDYFYVKWKLIHGKWWHITDTCQKMHAELRNVEPLPPLASFYRHNNFGREVLVVDTVSDSLSLARSLSPSPSLPSSPSLTPSHTRTHTHSRTRSLTRSLYPHPYALICPIRFFHITHLFSWHLIHVYHYITYPHAWIDLAPAYVSIWYEYIGFRHRLSCCRARRSERGIAHIWMRRVKYE